jgi:predicted glycosyltransferase
MGSSCYLAHDDVPETTDDDDISNRTTEEMEKYESLHRWEFAHTRIYDVNLLEKVGLDEELSTILRTISWGKLYDEPHLGIRWLKKWMDDFATVQTKMQASMDSQTSMMYGLFSHFRINHDA